MTFNRMLDLIYSQFWHYYHVRVLEQVEKMFFLQVDALIDDLEEDDNCLDDEVSRNWGEVLTQLYVFDRLEKQVQFLKRISKTKACKWLQRYTHPGENYRRLSIKVQCTGNY